MGPLEFDQGGDGSPRGWHHNLHLQPANSPNDDYMNLHMYYYGVLGSGGASQYAWLVTCTDGPVHRQCGSWNQTGFGGQIFEVSTASCLGNDKYTCAQYAAGDFIDCLTYYDQCNQAFVNQSFPQLATYLIQKDNYGDPGNIYNAFCETIAKVFSCQNR